MCNFLEQHLEATVSNDCFRTCLSIPKSTFLEVEAYNVKDSQVDSAPVGRERIPVPSPFLHLQPGELPPGDSRVPRILAVK